MTMSNEELLAEVQRSIRDREERVRLRPMDTEVRIDLARTLLLAGELLRALEVIQQALSMAPESARAHFNASEILFEIGEYSASLEFARSAASLLPTWPNARYLRGFRSLAHGLWLDAWQDMESRLVIDTYQRLATIPATPRWEGESLEGRHLLVDAEQGHGDTIQYVRFVFPLLAQGARITLRVQEPLVPLLLGCPGIQVLPISVAPPPHDCWIELLSLPYRMGLAEEAALGRAAYLAPTGPPPADLNVIPPPDGRPTVGVIWEARAAHPTSRRRSMPVDAVSLLMKRHPGIRFVSLQHFVDSPEHAAAALPAGLINGATVCTDFNRTAHLMMRLTHVVTVDTGPAHLAGALGVPATVLVNFAPDARWLLHRSDSPWYGSVRVIRQRRPYEWSDAFTELSAVMETLE